MILGTTNDQTSTKKISMDLWFIPVYVINSKYPRRDLWSIIVIGLVQRYQRKQSSRRFCNDELYVVKVFFSIATTQKGSSSNETFLAQMQSGFVKLIGKIFVKWKNLVAS